MTPKKLALTWIVILGFLSIPFWPIMEPDWKDYADCSGAFFSKGDITSSKEFSETALERAKEEGLSVTRDDIERRLARVFVNIMESEDIESTRRAYFDNCGI